MTQRSRVILFSSILLAASVIASSVMLIIETRGTLTGASTIMLSSGVILISILSVAFIYLIKIRKRADEKKLDPSYFQEFEIIKDTIKNSPLPKSDKDSITEDVLELMLTAQAHGKSVQATIGDTASFAKGILNACISKPRSIMVGLVNGIMTFMLFILLACTLLWLENFPAGFFNQRIDTIMVLFMAAISFALIPVMKQLVSKKRAWVYLIPLVVGFLFIGIVELLRAFLYNSNVVKTLLDGSIAMIPNIATLVGFLAAIMILFLVRVSVRRLPKLK